jgi:WhiB family transcriptional regulator, redox-sensing transcriptional regulator
VSSGTAGPVLAREVIVPLASIVYRDDADDQGWQARALCAQTDPEAFFPERGGSTREAKRVCRACEVKSDCLDYALGNDERFGVWGGMSERERRRIKRAAL